MRIPCILLLSSLILAAAADEWFETFGLVDVAAVLAEGDLARQHALVVTKVDDRGPAARAGLEVGDIVVGLGGLRVYGKGEYALIRYEYGSDDDDMVLSVLRGDRLIDLAITPSVHRTMGFNFAYDSAAAVTALFDRAGLAVDPQHDPIGFRAWLQFPKRELSAILQWFDADRETADLAWLQALDRQHRALCGQDFAAAAAELVEAPIPELSSLVSLYAGLAQRHRGGEIAPDPLRHGLALLDWIRLYPYPVVVGPELGELDPALKALGAALERNRRLPIALGGSYARAAAVPAGIELQGQAAHYVRSYGLALIDPRSHGGWPFRHQAVWRGNERRQLIADLERSVEGAASGRWYLEQVLAVPRLLQDRRDAGAFERATETMLATTEHSPYIAYAGLRILHQTQNMHHLWNTRGPLRRAFMAAEVQLSPKPSPFLAQLQAHDAWDTFFMLSADDDAYESVLDRVLVALRQPRSIEAFAAEVAALDDAVGVERRSELAAEYVDRFRGWCTREDMALLEQIVGDGRASGAVLDLGPALWWAQDRRPRQTSFFTPLRNLVWPQARDFDLAAVSAGLETIDWSDPAAQLEGLYRSSGNLATTLLIADVCAEHGQAGLATEYRGRVQRFLTAMERHAREVDHSKWWRSHVAWLGLVTLAASPVTAEAALEAGRWHFDQRVEDTSWTASWLSLAQAHLLLGHHAQAALALADSFEGKESEQQDERFVWPGGQVIRGEPQQRLELLRRLDAAGALDGVRAGIVAKAEAAMVPPGFAELLGVAPDSLGVAPPPTGSDDF